MVESETANGASEESAGRGAGAEATGAQRPAPGRILRKKTWLSRFLAVAFLAACLGAMALYGLYHRSRVGVWTYYFTVRPPMVWFGMLLPALAAGAFGVRKRWAVAGCVLCALAFLGCEETLGCLKAPFGARARGRF